MRLAYTAMGDSTGSLMPRLPLTLHRGDRSLDVVGLLDSGSAVNLLPYSMGLALGAAWDETAPIVRLAGALAHARAHGLLLSASHPQLTDNRPFQLVFAWTERDDVPLIFGQVNFFMEFDVCFFRSQGTFDVRPKGEPR
jgi:hypothetical protein